MLCLGLATADLRPGVGLAENGGVRWEVSRAEPKSRAQAIFVYLEEVIAAGKLDLKSLDLIAAAVGPGSFTGLKVGLAAAKGLAWALNLKVAPVSSLEALAAEAAALGPAGFVSPVLDARRGLIYAALFEARYQGLRRLEADQAVAPEDWARRLAALGKPVFLLGEGLKAYGPLFQDHLGPLARLAEPEAWPISPGQVAYLGLSQFKKALRPHDLKANYIRPVEAKRPQIPLRTI